jgi:hypothetical protein
VGRVEQQNLEEGKLKKGFEEGRRLNPDVFPTDFRMEQSLEGGGRVRGARGSNRGQQARTNHREGKTGGADEASRLCGREQTLEE